MAEDKENKKKPLRTKYTKEEAEILSEELQDGISKIESQFNDRHTVNLFGGEYDS